MRSLLGSGSGAGQSLRGLEAREDARPELLVLDVLPSDPSRALLILGLRQPPIVSSDSPAPPVNLSG